MNEFRIVMLFVCGAILLLCLLVLSIGYSVNRYNRQFIEAGYNQVSIMGVGGYHWQKSEAAK